MQTLIKKTISKIQKSIDEESGDMLNTNKNDAMFITGLPRQKRAKANLPVERQELLKRIKDVAFDVEGSIKVFVELKEILNELLQKHYNSTKKGNFFNIQMKKKKNTINWMLLIFSFQKKEKVFSSRWKTWKNERCLPNFYIDDKLKVWDVEEVHKKL